MAVNPDVLIVGGGVVGSAVADNQRVAAPSGRVLAFDARTGEQRWEFDPVPRDPNDPAMASWGKGTQGFGQGNVWSSMAVDQALDLVYLPTTSSSSDFFGADRPGDNHYTTSVVALRGATGQVAWHQQLVHHNVWDYDVPARPMLIDYPHAGKRPHERSWVGGKPASCRRSFAWTVKDSIELYNVSGWGREFFTINEAGHVEVTPAGKGSSKIDLKELVDDLRSRGINLPVLIRFSDILRTRVHELWGAFQQAIVDNDYRGTYRGVYPIKVNQQRHVVEELMEYGRPFGLWIEAGSKPELLVALALQENPEALILCNGYKDRAFIETALLAQKLGRRVVITMDRMGELDYRGCEQYHCHNRPIERRLIMRLSFVKGGGALPFQSCLFQVRSQQLSVGGHL